MIVPPLPVRESPNRFRRLLMWGVAINGVSLLTIVGVLWCLSRW